MFMAQERRPVQRNQPSNQPTNRSQVEREVRLHGGLLHENIITLHAAFVEGCYTVLVQEYAGGGDLWAFLQANSGHLGERTCVALVLQPFLLALHYLHSRGISHRDIKPGEPWCCIPLK
jgi:aurora kinase